MDEKSIKQDLLDLYADLGACLMAFANALESTGTVTKAEIAEAAQERFIDLCSNCKPGEALPHPLLMLRMLATNLTSTEPL